MEATPSTLPFRTVFTPVEDLSPNIFSSETPNIPRKKLKWFQSAFPFVYGIACNKNAVFSAPYDLLTGLLAPDLEC